jgi:hypothetical protein
VYDALERTYEAAQAYIAVLDGTPLHSGAHVNIGNYYLKIARYVIVECLYHSDMR